jgi:DNA primase
MTPEEILNSKHIAFTKSSKGFTIRCLNPEHPDLNPSMSVNQITGAFKCFSCGFHGSLYSHFDIEKDATSMAVASLLLKINSLLPNATNLTMPVGYFPFTEDFRNISGKTLSAFKAFTHEDFEGRIVFPIYDNAGTLVAFQGRYLYSETSPKYKFYPTAVKNLPLFPANVVPIQSSVIVVEGIFDMLNLYDKGITNVVTTFGCTPSKSITHKFDLLHIQGVTKIIIMYDGDEAGRKGADTLQSLLSNKFIVHKVLLEEGQDPGSLNPFQIKHLREELYGKY